jgi:molybdenum cofactor cytidylyltransferase
MNSAHKLCGVILAAGASSRMGRDKALLPWPPAAPAGGASGTLLSAAIRALQPFAQSAVVVAGKNAENIAPIVAACGAALVCNPAPERGQFSSLQIGLRAVLGCGCDAAMIAPVDAPPLSAASLERLRTAFEQALARGLWAVAPASDGRHGHPLLAGRALIDAFLAAPATSNAREVKRAHAASIEYVPVPDPFVSADVNTPQEYAALAERASGQPHST